MNIVDKVRQGISRLAREHGGPTALAEKAGVGQPNVSRFLSGKAMPRFDTIARLLETMGVRILFPDEECDTNKPVVFVPARRCNPAALGADLARPVGILCTEGYQPIPLARNAAAASLGSIPQEVVRGWVLALEGQPSMRCRNSLMAYEVAQGQQSMVPTLHPKDVVLVDRDDFRPEPDGSLFLVRTPGAQAEVTVKRVYSSRTQGRTLLTFVDDNPDKHTFPPAVHSLETDWQGGLRQAIVGRVVRVWADMTRK